MKKISLLTLLLLTANWPSFAATSARDTVSACKSWLTRADIAHSRVGVEVMELPSGKVIFESSGSAYLICSAPITSIAPG